MQVCRFDGNKRGFSFDQGRSRAKIWRDVDNSRASAAPAMV
jgi:hypothetical protein